LDCQAISQQQTQQNSALPNGNVKALGAASAVNGALQSIERWISHGSSSSAVDNAAAAVAAASSGPIGVSEGVLPAVRDILRPLRCMPGLKVKQVRMVVIVHVGCLYAAQPDISVTILGGC
jgi:hypothetical protein